MERLSYAIPEWCALNGFKRGYFYILDGRNEAPETIGKGKARRITADAARRWQQAQERKARNAGRARGEVR